MKHIIEVTVNPKNRSNWNVECLGVGCDWAEEGVVSFRRASMAGDEHVTEMRYKEEGVIAHGVS